MGEYSSQQQGTGQAQRDISTSFSSLVDIDLFGTSNSGKLRRSNEDHFVVVRCERVLETTFSNMLDNQPGNRVEETAYGMIVADGVGGEAAGEVASHEAIYGLLSLALQTPDWQFKWGPKEKNTVKWRMQDRFRRVNAALFQQAASHAALRGMCSTMTAALSHGTDLIIGHVGDSRAYLMRHGKLKRLTRDHTLAERLFDNRDTGENDRLIVELRNVLMQALGASDTECQPEVHDYVLEDGDQLLLCTDGLTDMVEDELIEAVLNRGANASVACRNLVDLALSHGGRDNVTAIVARYSIPET